jgi:hypothetical protein
MRRGWLSPSTSRDPALSLHQDYTHTHTIQSKFNLNREFCRDWCRESREIFFPKKRVVKIFRIKKSKSSTHFHLGVCYFISRRNGGIFTRKRPWATLRVLSSVTRLPPCVYTLIFSPPFSIVVFQGTLKSQTLSLLVFLTLNHFAGETFFLLLFGIERIF